MNHVCRILLLCAILSFIGCSEDVHNQQSNKLYNELSVYDSLFDVNAAKAEEISRLLSKEAFERDDDTILLKAYYLNSKIQFENGLKEQSITYGKKALLLAKKIKNVKVENCIYLLLGNYHLQKSDYSKALDFYLKAQNYFENEKDNSNLGKLYNALGIFYFETGDLNKSRKYFDKSCQIYQLDNNELGIGIYYANVGNIYMIKQDFKSALKYQERSYQTFAHLKDTTRLVSCIINIANINSNLKKYDFALKELDNALILSKNSNNNSLYERILLNYAILYSEKGDLAKAKEYSVKQVALAKQINSPKGRLDGYDQLAIIAGKESNYKEYSEYLKKYYQLKDSLNGSEVKQRIEELRWSNEFEKSKAESDLIKSRYEIEHERSNNLLIISILTVFAAILIIGLGWVLYRGKRKNLIISQIENERLVERIHIEQLNTEKEKAENDLLKIKSEQQIQELDTKNREITSISLQLVAKNKIMAQISKLINERKSSVTDIENELKSILFQNQNQDRDWEQFKEVFEKVHPGFYENLKEKFPQLTATDCRICAYIKIRMSLNEVASLMNISLQSLHTSRYRIRKKLGLEPEVNLDDFILNFGL